jgi:hypothetical protein
MVNVSMIIVYPHNGQLFSSKKEWTNDKLITQATMQMNFKSIMLGERNQVQKTIYHMIPFS